MLFTAPLTPFLFDTFMVIGRLLYLIYYINTTGLLYLVLVSTLAKLEPYKGIQHRYVRIIKYRLQTKLDVI